MKTPTTGTLDWYREMGKTNHDIAALVAMIDRQSAIIVATLEAMVAERRKNQQEAA